MTLFLTVGVRDTNHRDEFHITTFFRVRFAKGVSLLSTSEFLLWSYSNKTFRTKAFFISNHLRRIYLNARDFISQTVLLFALLMLKNGSCCCVFIRGKHPVCGEPLFCFSAIPDSLSTLCGFHINHRSSLLSS